MEDSKLIQQLRAELASENQEITTIIEQQEQFYDYLNELEQRVSVDKKLIEEIKTNFKRMMI